MNIDFKNVTTKEEMQTLSLEELAKVTKGGKFHSEQIKNSLAYSEIKIKEGRGKEIAFILHNYSNLSITAKYLLASSIIMSNDESLITYLIKNGFNYFQIYRCSKLISKLKEYYNITDKPLDMDISTLEKLCFLIKKYYGISDNNLIIAKINELVVFKADLFEKLSKKDKSNSVRK